MNSPSPHQPRLLRIFLPLLLTLRMSGSNPDLHPLSQAIDPGDIQFKLRSAAAAGEDYAVEAVYRPRREWDVKKSRNLGLLGGWIGGNSGELIRTQRETFHSLRQQFTATNSEMDFTVPLRDPDADFKSYQLESVRIVGRLTGTFRFERWFPDHPTLDSGFGLHCAKDRLHGNLRPSGLASAPLQGSLPLWPTLRQVELDFAPVHVPGLHLFEASAKQHWDGWRKTSPQSWPGGQTIVLRHTNTPTVWRANEYHPFPAGGDAPHTRPQPPAGILPGVHVEVFWPEGDVLDFPETRFDSDVEMVSVPVSKLPSRAAELLADAVRLRPGLEHGSLSAKEWEELEVSLPETDRPLTLEMASPKDDQSILRITREPGFTEPWLCLFVTPYDGERRILVTTLLISPHRWPGPLPQ